LFICGGGQLYGLLLAVQPGHAAQAKAEAVTLGLGQVVQCFAVRVHAAGGNFMQQRFPDMGARGIHQRDVQLGRAPCQPSQTAGQHQATGATTDNHDFFCAKTCRLLMPAGRILPFMHQVVA
jgi:hypothetical protein